MKMSDVQNMLEKRGFSEIEIRLMTLEAILDCLPLRELLKRDDVCDKMISAANKRETFYRDLEEKQS